MKTFRIEIQGLVQGVGFRPFIYRIAHDLKLNGTVENRNDGVVIRVNTTESRLQLFIKRIHALLPQAATIASLHYVSEPVLAPFQEFSIIKSSVVSDEVTEVSPDIAVCPACINDMKEQAHRLSYPFINCTHCGPRFTIIADLPYDREKTSMSPFVMCATCRQEYTDVLDRRFHAQPVACNDCGPEYALHTSARTITGLAEILASVVGILDTGEVVAIKGLGGYFLACDALNETACQKLREVKNRDGKPFAVMFRDMETLKEFARVSPKEEELLRSFRRPVVLLEQKKPMPRVLNSGLNRLGCLLPYMPLHHLLFSRYPGPAIVMTSGNISDEPILISNEKALQTFVGFAAGVLTYDREIVNRCDDSVSFVVRETPRLIRRSRGYVPNPVRLGSNVEGIFAAGAELKNTFCIGKGQQAIVSQHIGDLKNVETFEFYGEAFERFRKLFRFDPRVVGCDLHPDYLSSRFAAELGVERIEVQHHHAHIASVMAEHRLSEKVIGVSFDGTGLGDDQAVWGGEFLVCDLKGYERVGHLAYVPLPGGDAAASRPWQMAVSYLNETFGPMFTGFDLPFLKMIDSQQIQVLLHGIEKRINTPMTSSAGRLFDAVAALNGLCLQHSYEAEGPMLLESLIDKNCTESYSFDSIGNTIGFSSMFVEMVNDILKNKSITEISARFHNGVVEAIVSRCETIHRDTKISDIALSGGVFQNAFVLEKTEEILIGKGFKVYSNVQVPANDGGISLGQLAVAAQKR